MKNDYWGFLNVPMIGPTLKQNIVMAHSSIAYSLFLIQLLSLNKEAPATLNSFCQQVLLFHNEQFINSSRYHSWS